MGSIRSSKVSYYSFVLLWASYGDVQQIVVAYRSHSSRVERHGESDLFPTYSRFVVE
jgi:hypothetical protein